VRAYVKKAGKAVTLMYWAANWVNVVKRLRPAPRLEYLSWGPHIRVLRRIREALKSDYRAYEPNVRTVKRARNIPRIYWAADLRVMVQRIRPEVTVIFCNVNDMGPRRTIVCVDKVRGDPGCSDNAGDSVGGVLIPPGRCTGPGMAFRFRRLVTAFVTSEGGRYWSVSFRGPDGRVVKICPQVDRFNPCVLTIDEFMAVYSPT